MSLDPNRNQKFGSYTDDVLQLKIYWFLVFQHILYNEICMLNAIEFGILWDIKVRGNLCCFFVYVTLRQI